VGKLLQANDATPARQLVVALDEADVSPELLSALLRDTGAVRAWANSLKTIVRDRDLLGPDSDELWQPVEEVELTSDWRPAGPVFQFKRDAEGRILGRYLMGGRVASPEEHHWAPSMTFHLSEAWHQPQSGLRLRLVSPSRLAMRLAK
jgi:hypothetical protein